MTKLTMETAYFGLRKQTYVDIIRLPIVNPKSIHHFQFLFRLPMKDAQSFGTCKQIQNIEHDSKTTAQNPTKELRK
jgi:hypothetical protein